jgi:adenosine deaminase
MRKQREQVIDIMRQNGGYATFGQLYQLVDFSTWKTKTPQASVRRIVQQSDMFFRIQSGLWALQESKETILQKFQIKSKNKNKEEIFTHSYYQGLVVEIGNMKHMRTYVPPQDKNRLFLEKPLKEITALDEIYNFTYPEILRKAETVDVIWFNERHLPNAFFEIEHSTDIQNSLTKFFELQDYFAQFYIVAPAFRKKQFDDIMNKTIFKPVKERIKFVDYENIGNQYSKMYELSQVRQLI